jgi:hypothetical protein
MSTDDFEVDPLRDLEVREHAKTLRRSLGWANAERVDPLLLETAGEIWTVRGKKPFALEFASDAEMPGDSGLTVYDRSKIVVKIPRRVRHRAFMGDGYARYTVAHELGHAVLHVDKLMEGAALPRRHGGNVSVPWIPKFKSAEHQAMVFAGAFLINDDTARALSSADEVSVQAGVSLTAARIYGRLWRRDLSIRRSRFSMRSAPAAASRSSFRSDTSSCARPATRSTTASRMETKSSSGVDLAGVGLNPRGSWAERNGN